MVNVSGRIVFVLLFGIAVLPGCSKPTKPVVDKLQTRVVVENVGFEAPESAKYWAAKDLYLVSNINGKPLEKDGNGFISQINPDGNVVNLKWIDGTKEGTTLHGPKGMSILGDLLFVADIDAVQIFELPSGKQKTTIKIKGSTFLNGVAPGAGDFVYVADSGLNQVDGKFQDSGSDAVWKVWANGKYEAVAKGKELGRPNGVVADGNDVVVNTYGTGEVYRLDPTGKKTLICKPPSGALDGLLNLKDGRFLVTSWKGSAIYVINQDKTCGVFADKLEGPADMGFDSKRNRVLLPMLTLNKLMILPHRR